MTRVEFMEQLEHLLSNVSIAEKEEALQYYNDYFDDAGEENEQQVIASLGTPEAVAESIQKDTAAQMAAAEANDDTAVIQYQEVYSERQEERFSPEPPKNTSLPTWVIVLLIILAVFACPALFGSIFGALGGIFGLLAGWLCLCIVPFVVAIAFFAAFVVALIGAILSLLLAPYVGLASLGVAFVSLGIGLFSLMFGVFMVGKATPAIFTGIKKGLVWVKEKIATRKGEY